MTSEVDSTKTNEFLRRRKLRLQQVREQSKDIAKKIRQRAKVENLRQVIELDSKKKKDFLQKQERLVKKLEEYYAEGLESVGVGHKNASEVWLQLQDGQGDRIDLSKQRGKEAAAELRKKRQQILDKQKKILDRKLQAREVANEISRDKSAAINKLVLKPNDEISDDIQSKSSLADSNKNDNKVKGKDIARTDMATQWDLDEIPQEWEPNIPTLSLPKDDNSVKETNNNNIDSKSDKSKRLDLFALSEEMPSSLRGNLTNNDERRPVKSSLTLISEYLQNRDLRLREPDVAPINKNKEDIQSLKQTIFRTRTSKEVSGKEDTIDKQSKTSKCTESAMPKKSLVTMYNHATRDVRDIPYSDERLVTRNLQDADDAYSLAMKESSVSQIASKDPHKKVQKIRSKVAVAKQNVEREYRDTISFLNALPKDKGNKPIKTAYMDEQRQEMHKDMRQQRLQQEYRKIERECSKHSCENKRRSKSKSPVKERGDAFDSTDFQYSWMPVPESDGNLAIHTIPTSLKEGKSNSVKFSQVDSYHEYRSRHKHTPPTKQDAPGKSKPSQTRLDETSSDESTSSFSSVQSVRRGKTDKQVVDTNLQNLSDAERIIIYKILDSKADDKKTSKLMKSIAKSLTRIESKTKDDNVVQNKSEGIKTSGNVSPKNIVSLEQIDEGVYKTVNENRDNIASMYFQDRDGHMESQNLTKGIRSSKNHQSKCRKRNKTEIESSRALDSGDKHHLRSLSSCGRECNCNCMTRKSEEKSVQESYVPVAQPSATTSSTSFKTAANEKTTPPDDGFIKLIDDAGQEAGKFFIGASGLLNNDAYEVVIQVRKKGDEKEFASDKSNNNKEEPLDIDKVTVVSSTQTCSGDIYNYTKDKHPILIDPQESNKTEAGNDSDTKATEKTSKELIINNELPRTSATAKTTDTIENKVSKQRDSVVVEESIADHVSKPSVTTSRPATSTQTQTSLNSPSHRPAFFHMSSSTSTAYMSPPEFIVPKFMKPGFSLTDEEMYDPKNYTLGDDDVTAEHAYSMEDTCDCRKCMHADRRYKPVHATGHRCSKSKYIGGTPPNTARSCLSADMYYNKECDDTRKNAERVKKPKCLSNKCSNHTQSHHSGTNKFPAQNFGIHIPSSTALFKKGETSSKRSKTDLKPVIKNYVDKLLVLNKESLKAVQIVDQDCSSVTTPSSSVVEVPNNIDKTKPDCVDMLSLQKIEVMLNQKNIDGSGKKHSDCKRNSQVCYRLQSSKRIKIPKLPRRKTLHKVKSLNVSRKKSKTKTCDREFSHHKAFYSSSSKKSSFEEIQMPSIPSRGKVRSNSSPTPRLPPNSDITDKSTNSDVNPKLTIPKFKSKFSERKSHHGSLNEPKTRTIPRSESSNRAMTSTSNDSDRNPSTKKDKIEVPLSISTQTSMNVDSEMNYMKLAEDKLQNMEKIADLTDKCTKRLSNLAKVLEEVRKNKTLAYSHITTSDTSDSDHKSDKDANKPPRRSQDVAKMLESKSLEPTTISKKDTPKDDENSRNSTKFIPFLSNIPKPVAFKSLNSGFEIHSSSSSSRHSSSPERNQGNQSNNNHRAKPPPALSRIHLKHGQDFVVPHELSTVVEVDSPMSVKLKSSRNETRLDAPEASNSRSNGVKNDEYHSALVELKLGDKNNPDLLDNNEVSNLAKTKSSTAEPSNNSKLQMIDIEQFNEIMLKPFYSIQEYVKQRNIGTLEDGSNVEDIIKSDQINDELSSLHSEASLPDVISELLKRNIISEPFKFDNGSNANSTTVSSESTMSVLALSRARHGKDSSNAMFQNNDNIGETSDTTSFSSNPDLENAFKKLGMGWASSTLKKTKERLALSSSSNTSSSSLSKFKMKSFNQDVPAIVTDTVSSVLSLPSQLPQRNAADNSKNAQQQTSKTCAMTVKEFLTTELAKKITFDSNSKNETKDEYVTLYETKMPEQMKHSSLMVREDNRSIDNSLQSNNNRARTSTPVQLYKSMTYQSSSSSNLSNGLFSNVEDLSSVKATSNSMKHSTSDKDDLIIPNFSLRMKKPPSDKSN